MNTIEPKNINISVGADIYESLLNKRYRIELDDGKDFAAELIGIRDGIFYFKSKSGRIFADRADTIRNLSELV